MRYVMRGLRGQCPRCGAAELFSSRLRLHAHCPRCALPLEQEDGWSLGAIPLNYALIGVGWILPTCAAYAFGWIGFRITLFLSGFGALLGPFLLFRFTKSAWVGLYYSILPNELEEDDDGPPQID